MTAKPFVNKHLSFSRLSRFEQCGLAFKLHYIDKLQAEPGVPLKFGKLVHAVLETLVREHMQEERTGPLSEERALDLYRQGWAAEGLTGIEVFEEGLAPLLEKVHGSSHYVGPEPGVGSRRERTATALEQELLELRRRLPRAVKDEDYEQAARIRDRIRELEALLMEGRNG